MPTPVERATVVGAGGMGTFCALALAQRGTRVALWAHLADRADALRAARENTRYLPGHSLPDLIHVTHDDGEALDKTQLIVSAVPCQHMRAIWKRWSNQRSVGAPIVSVAKGIEIETLMRPTQILSDLLPDASVAALSGPCLAPEAAAGLPTAVVVAAADAQLANLVQAAFSTRTFRVYTNTDVIGVELAGAAKNVIAIAAGACDGLKLGGNAKASLLTRGLVEITRLGLALGANAETFRGLAGIGDLIVTCTSSVSRNHTAGEKIARGMSVEQVIATSNGIIEGIDSTRSILRLAQLHHVEMPITQAIHGVLFEHQSPTEMIEALMTRQLKGE